MFQMRPLTIFFLCLICQTLALADDAKTGAYSTTFTDRSPQSAIAFQAGRFGWNMTQLKASEFEKDYDLSNESFEVFVPESYKTGEKWGLFVWVSPGGGGRLHENWREILEKHKLIWIGPNKVGNERAIWCRMGLAIDAVHNMKKNYDLDPNRIYISGASGGGRIASMLGVCYPDIFKGGIYMIGCNFYKEMTAPNSGGKVWHRGYAPPPATILMQAKKSVAHVLLTGETDPNREQTHVYYDEFKKDGFASVTYIEVPKMGHQPPDREWFEKGLIAAMEDLITAKAEAPKVSEPKAKPAAAAPTTDDADKLLRNAKVYIDNQRWSDARDRLQNILAKYPDSPAAKEAKVLLKQIEKE
jgi:predicted esterase